jgi:streptomycin 6-kinase
VEVERVSETTTALLAVGVRDHQPVVLKVVKDGADEWRAGEVLAAFDGQGAARVYEYCDASSVSRAR